MSNTYESQRSDAVAQIASKGFTTDLWIPEFGWDHTEEEASESAFPAQLLAGMQCFQWFFTSLIQRCWVHLAAEMQAGKTGVVTVLLRLILANARILKIRPNGIFVITGMSDDAWRKQTRLRLPSALRKNVHHSKTLSQVQRELHQLHAAGTLENILIVLDESHIASNNRNLPSRLIYETVRSLCPMAQWQEKNIRFLTISATDPVKVIAMTSEAAPFPSQLVRLQTTEDYQSVSKLHTAGRLRFCESFGDLHEQVAINEVRRCIVSEFNSAPLYHILRPRMKKQDQVAEKLKAAFPDAIVIAWDSEAKPRVAAGGAGAATEGSSTTMDDINDLLRTPPVKTTFILLKNMFYAAKTMHDEYVGINYDRIGGKDDTNLQSLLGRACGYGKSIRTVIYCSRQTVENYESCWRELCSNPAFPSVIEGIPAVKLDKKMNGIVASHTAGGGASLSAAGTIATPFGTGLGFSAAATGSSRKQPANEDNFTSEWREFPTFAAAKAVAPRIREPKKEGGFYITTTTSSKKQRYADILVMKNGKKTAHMPFNTLKTIGSKVQRLYVGYRNEHDPSTAVFFVRSLTRTRL